MSVAEKLEALDAEYGQGDFKAKRGQYLAASLVDALPEIIAVVKAAEAVSEKERTGTLPDFMPMAVALSALDEGLSGNFGSATEPEAPTPQ